MNPVLFNYKNEKNRVRQGLIAEDVYKILPSVVTVPIDNYDVDDDVTNGALIEESSENAPSIDYASIVPYLIKFAQVQNYRIDELERRLEEWTK